MVGCRAWVRTGLGFVPGLGAGFRACGAGPGGEIGQVEVGGGARGRVWFLMERGMVSGLGLAQLVAA